MEINNKDYKKTEKWWLGLVVFFYLLYNLPGFPPYGDPIAAIWHGIFTLVPLWFVIYYGLFKLLRSRKFRELNSDTLHQEMNSPE